MRLLLIEDNARLVQALELGLREDNIEVTSVGTGAAAIDHTTRAAYEIVVLDLGLPDMDGTEVLRAIRQGPQAHIPVLVLTARDAVEARVQALDAGADDYLIKPFAFAELVARLRALTRRAAGPRFTSLISDALILDDDLGVRFGDQRVLLSPREHTLLTYLLRRRDEVVPRTDILREVFGYSGDPGTNTIDVHLAHLRRKLADAPIVLETVRGVGIRVRLERP